MLIRAPFLGVCALLLTLSACDFGRVQNPAATPAPAAGQNAGANQSANTILAPTTLQIASLHPSGGLKFFTIELSQFAYVGSPAFSSDGQWLAFDGYNGGYQGAAPECWIVRSDGTQAKKIAVGQTPRWSPDGTKLVFMRAREQDRQLGLGIFIVNTDGTDEHHICDGRWPDWSPDGNRLVFAVGGQSDRGGAWPGSRVCISNIDGGDIEEIGNGDCPSWSADGSKVACCFVDPKVPAPMLRVIDVESKSDSLLAYGWYRANWSSDGQHLYANSVSQSGQPGMFRFGLEQGQAPIPLFDSIAGAESPCQSRNGQQIVFAAPRDRQ